MPKTHPTDEPAEPARPTPTDAAQPNDARPTDESTHAETEQAIEWEHDEPSQP